MGFDPNSDSAYQVLRLQTGKSDMPQLHPPPGNNYNLKWQRDDSIIPRRMAWEQLSRVRPSEEPNADPNYP